MYHPYDTKKYPVRKNPRLQGYDYSTENFYFVTICTHEKHCLFGRFGDKNALRIIAEEGISQIPIHFPAARIEKYVVMPNHVHILIYLSGGRSKLDHIIGCYKAHVTRQIHKIRPDVKIWQESFHDHIIRNERAYQNIWLYIDSNPMNWENDCFFTLPETMCTV